MGDSTTADSYRAGKGTVCKERSSVNCGAALPVCLRAGDWGSVIHAVVCGFGIGLNCGVPCKPSITALANYFSSNERVFYTNCPNDAVYFDPNGQVLMTAVYVIGKKSSIYFEKFALNPLTAQPLCGTIDEAVTGRNGGNERY